MRWIGNLGLGMIFTPLIMFSIPIYAVVREPGIAVEHWDFYLFWVALPIAAGVALWIYSRKHKPVEKPE